MSISVRREFQQLISQATLEIADELLGLPLPLYTSSTATPIIFIMSPEADESSVEDYMKMQTEATTKIFSVSRQRVNIIVNGQNTRLWAPGTVFRFQAGQYILFNDFQWVIQKVSESTGLAARYDLMTKRSHAQRAI